MFFYRIPAPNEAMVVSGSNAAATVANSAS